MATLSWSVATQRIRDGLWTPRDGLWTPRDGMWTPEVELWTRTDELWTHVYSLWTLGAIKFDVSYDIFLALIRIIEESEE